jgi:hypothetical protein
MKLRAKLHSAKGMCLPLKRCATRLTSTSTSSGGEARLMNTLSNQDPTP